MMSAERGVGRAEVEMENQEGLARSLFSSPSIASLPVDTHPPNKREANETYSAETPRTVGSMAHLQHVIEVERAPCRSREWRERGRRLFCRVAGVEAGGGITRKDPPKHGEGLLIQIQGDRLEPLRVSLLLLLLLCVTVARRGRNTGHRDGKMSDSVWVGGARDQGSVFNGEG